MLCDLCESVEGSGESLLITVTQGPTLMETQRPHALLWSAQQGALLIQITSAHIEVSRISHKSHLISDCVGSVVIPGVLEKEPNIYE